MQQFNSIFQKYFYYFEFINPIVILILSIINFLFISINTIVKFNNNLNSKILILILIISLICIFISLISIILFTIINTLLENSKKPIPYLLIISNILFLIIGLHLLPLTFYLFEFTFNSDPFKSLLTQFESVQKINIFQYYLFIWSLWITTIPNLLNILKTKKLFNKKL